VIPLGVKKETGQQKFRIPFKNKGAQDLEVEFSFLENSTAVNTPALIRCNSLGSTESKNNSPVDFSIPTATLTVPANNPQAVVLNVSAKLKNSYHLSEEANKKALRLLTRSNSSVSKSDVAFFGQCDSESNSQ